MRSTSKSRSNSATALMTFMVSLPVELVRSTPPSASNDPHAKFGELRHRGAHVHHIAAEPIELGDASTSPGSSRSSR